MLVLVTNERLQAESLMLHFFNRQLRYSAIFVLMAASLSAQDGNHSVDTPITPDKRAFGVIPNYKTVEPGMKSDDMTVRDKFNIAAKDTFDYPIFFVTGALAGISHLQNQNSDFGQGGKGYAHRYVTGYADQAITTMMTEAVGPSIFHHDLRYYRKAEGSTMSRLGYTLSRILVTRTDSGGKSINYSEFFANGAAAGIANAYYPGSRTLSDNATRFATFIGTDAMGNVLKEFWPDIKHKVLKK